MAIFSEQTPVKFKAPIGLLPDKVLSAPIGLASPLWLAFAGAASAGVAYWWLTRWMRPVNLEAVSSETIAIIDIPVIEPEAVLEALSPEPEPLPELEPEPEQIFAPEPV